MNSLERIRKVIYFVRKLQTVGGGSTQLLHSADGSENGYCSASCIRQVNTQDAYVTFVLGKYTKKRQQTMTHQWKHLTDYASRVMSPVKFKQQKRLVHARQLPW